MPFLQTAQTRLAAGCVVSAMPDGLPVCAAAIPWADGGSCRLSETGEIDGVGERK